MKLSHSGTTRRGSAILEFALAGSFIFLPLLAGMTTVGMSMLMAMEVAGVNRDAGHMFASGADFSQTPTRNVLLQLASSLNLTDAGGNGVIILTEIDGTGVNQAVCARRFVIGNAGLRASSFVNPSAGIIDAGGAVTNLNDPSAQVNPSFTALLPMTQGQIAYVVETYASTAKYDWTGVLTGTGIYMKAIF